MDVESTKNKDKVTYRKLSNEEVSNLEEYSSIKVWENKSNHDIADIIVFSDKMEAEGEYTMESNNSQESESTTLTGFIEDINDKGIVMNLSTTQELEDGSSVAMSGRDEYANLVNVEFKDDTKFKLITSSGKVIESRDFSKEELEKNCSVILNGI